MLLESPDSWHETLLWFIGAARVPGLLFSRMIQSTIREYAATLVAKKENLEKSKLANILSTFWYIAASWLMDAIFSVKPPSYKEIMELAYQKHTSNGVCNHNEAGENKA